jgi:hypothetical protein
MSDYLQDAALISIAFDLPMFDHQLLSAERGRAPNPKDARTKQILSCGVIKHEPRVWRKSSHVKRILHEQKDVNVIRSAFAVTNEPKTIKRARWPDERARS